MLIPTAGRAESGFALLLVLWTLVLISFLVTQITATGRAESRIARNLLANSKAQAAADGAIYEAAFHLLDPVPDTRWAADRSPHELIIGASRVIVRIEDEAWRVNPSLASPELLEALLKITGTGAETAHRLATAITEWVGSAPIARPLKAVLADYRAAGLDYGPPSSPLESLDELQSVVGMTPLIYSKLKPHLTLFGPAQSSKASQDPLVLAALGEPAVQTASLAASPPPDVLTVRIIADSVSQNGHAGRVAIMRIGTVFAEGYEMLDWAHEED